VNLFRRLMYPPEVATGLCRTCSWGTVRKGFLPADVEVFCRIVGPSARVGYAVRECTSYCDRRAPESVPEIRRYGFVTEIKLEDGSELRVARPK
jgi:hypothetical protein